MEKENQRVAISRRLLKEGLLRLLAHKELNKISVIELCRESSINRATFYRHYQTPEDVMREIEMDFVREMFEAITGTSTLAPKSVEEMREQIYQICCYAYAHADMVRLFLRSRTGSDIVKELNRDIWNTHLEIAMRSRVDKNTWQLGTTFLGFGSYHLLRRWLLDDVPMTPREVSDLLYMMVNFEAIGLPVQG